MSRCLACEEGAVEPFLALGEMALANRFLTHEELDREEPRYPLTMSCCRGCGHVQLADPVPPVEMFGHYLYVSSVSDTLVRHLEALARTSVERLKLRPQDLVVDIGCNDGTLLAAFKAAGVRVLGVDPAANLQDLARQRGVPVVCDYFGARLGPELATRHGRARLITCTNTFLHIPDLSDFMRGLDALLAPGGTFLIEFHYLVDLLAQRAFDTIYHEHCSYWALRPLARFFARQGYAVVDVERQPVHHGQLRVFVQRAREAAAAGPRVEETLALERQLGLDGVEPLRAFARDAHAIRDQLNALLDTLCAQGRVVVGYGAPAKGSTLLNFAGIGPNRLRYIVDRSPLKQGRYTPGTHIPIVPTQRLLEDQPDAVLLLAWNFMDEIAAQQAEYRRRGGKFIVPVPTVTLW